MAICEQQVKEALKATGSCLGERGVAGPIRLHIAGGVAGMLASILRASRTTGDCDVIALAPEEHWPSVEAAAKHIAPEFDLPAAWLNRQAAMYAWTLPPGWEARCEPVGTFGPLEAQRISRLDLIATKIVSAPKRPQDLEDLNDIAPTHEELDFAHKNLNRLEAESLQGERFADQQAILDALRGGS